MLMNFDGQIQNKRCVLVTGGAGFIGSHVVELLLGCGYEVLVYDNLSSGSRKNLPLAECQLIIESVDDLPALEAAMGQVDAVVHLAAHVSVEESLRNPCAAFQANALGAFNVFEAARRSGLTKGLVYASSSAVYGNATILPCDEEALLRPCSPYGADKAYAEMLAQAFASSFGIRSVGLRFFNVYGSRQLPNSAYSGVISRFFNQVQAGKVFDVLGDGEQTRDFVDVRDVASAVLAGLNQCHSCSSVNSFVYNVGSGRQTSINELAASIARAAGKPCKIRHGPARQGEVRHSQADIQRINETLGWQPSINLEVGLKDLFAGQPECGE